MHRRFRLRARTLAKVSLLVALGLSGCASTAPGEDFDLGATPLVGRRASEIVRLRTRQGDVALLAGDGGRRVVIYDAHGGPARSAEVTALRATDPALYELFTNAVAAHAGKSFLDATFTPPRDSPIDGRDADDARAR